MPAPPDPQASPQPSDGPAAGDVDASGAARLLDEIRERLERLEGSLSLRERRVTRLERTLREADAKLQAERAKYAAEHEALERGLPQQLHERDRQLHECQQQLEAAAHNREDLEKRLAAQLVREHETLAHIEKLTQERDLAAAGLEQARQETREVQRRQRELEAQLEDINRRRSEWEHAVSASPPPKASGPPAIPPDLPKWLSPVLRLWPRWRKLPAGRRIAIAATAIILPIACILSAVTTYSQYPRAYRVTGSLAVPAEDSALLATLEAAPALHHVEIHKQASVPVLVASKIEHDRGLGLQQVYEALQDRLRLVQAATAGQPATQPARRLEREQYENERRQIEVRTAALTTRPAGGPADPAALLAGWQKKLSEQQALDASIAELDGKLRQKPPEAAAVQLAPDRLAAAIAADPRLQADSDVLAQRESSLADALRKIVDAAHPAFAELAQTAAVADKSLEETLAKQQEPGAVEAVQAVRSALTSCAKAGVALAKTWQDERQTLDAGGPGVDVAARYKAIEAAARQFADSTGNSLAGLRKSLDAIAQGGSDTAQPLILRNNVARQIQPALDACEALNATGRRVSPAENVELAALVQGAGGLRVQVQERRARLEQDLRDQALAELRAAYDRDVQQSRAQREELAAKAAGLEAGIISSAAEALGLLSGSQSREAALAELVELTRRRLELDAKLAALDRADAKDAADAARWSAMSCPAAMAEDITSTRALAGWTLAGGLAPVLLLGIVAGVFWGMRTWRQPRGSLDDYTKALRYVPSRKPAKKHAQKRRR